MRKPDFCLCENKDADQLCSNGRADQRLYFRYMDSTIPPYLYPKVQDSSFLLWVYMSFVLDLVEIPEHQFSGAVARIIKPT